MSDQTITVSCPHCRSDVDVLFDGTYKPRFKICNACWKRFVYEKTRDGMAVIKASEAENCSNPEYRESELGAGDEE